MHCENMLTLSQGIIARDDNAHNAEQFMPSATTLGTGTTPRRHCPEEKKQEVKRVVVNGATTYGTGVKVTHHSAGVIRLNAPRIPFATFPTSETSERNSAHTHTNSSVSSTGTRSEASLSVYSCR